MAENTAKKPTRSMTWGEYLFSVGLMLLGLAITMPIVLWLGFRGIAVPITGLFTIFLVHWIVWPWIKSRRRNDAG